MSEEEVRGSIKACRAKNRRCLDSFAPGATRFVLEEVLHYIETEKARQDETAAV